MLVLAAVFVCHIADIIILLVATIDNGWFVSDVRSTGLWGRWDYVEGVWNLTSLPPSPSYPKEYLQAVQASSILACIFSIIGLFVFVAQLFTLPKGQRFIASGVFQFLAFLCIMIAASIYTDRFHLNEQELGHYGHCYILAWIAFVLSFISSITYFVLRKK
ncbi:epithelial membrane protein 1 isoform 1-T3 [Pholidichthys leucotaenia]